MKVPFSWLKEFVDIDVTAQELEEKLFSYGFEVEELIPLDAGISKVVVGKIVEMEKQEGTHLTKCVVDCGDYGHDIRISTGASNMKRLRARCAGWLHPARRHQDQGPQDAGRGVQRYAVLRRRTGSER
mgnify:CR=1 FL=1